MIKTFYHYSTHINQIKLTGHINDTSFSKTNTHDIVLEICPEVILDKKEIKKFQKDKKIKKPRTYESKYQNRLRYRNQLFNEFFNRNKFILAFDEKLPRGWIKLGLLPLLANKIGRQYLKFNISKQTAKKSFALEQKFWSPIHIYRKFKVNAWNPKFKIEKHPEIAKYVFGEYYSSIKRLSNYKKGEFEAPEFWIAGKIPFNQCEIGEITSRRLQILLEEREKIREALNLVS